MIAASFKRLQQLYLANAKVEENMRLEILLMDILLKLKLEDNDEKISQAIATTYSKSPRVKIDDKGYIVEQDNKNNSESEQNNKNKYVSEQDSKNKTESEQNKKIILENKQNELIANLI